MFQLLRLNSPALGVGILGIGLLVSPVAKADPLVISKIELDDAGRPHITHNADAQSYFVLQRGYTLTGVTEARDAHLGTGPQGELTDSNPPPSAAFYRVLQIPLNQPEDLDRDGLDDVYELQRSPALNPLNAADALQDADGDLRLNLAEARAGTDPLVPDFFVLTSPENHETGVSVHRETQFRFTVPLASGSTIEPTQFWAEAGGRRLLTRIELSPDRRTATLFYLEPVPGGTRVRVWMDGAGLSDERNRSLDLDADGKPGGRAAIEFTTSGVAAVAGTAVIGQVFASERQPDPQSPTGFTNRPLGGVTITVDGAEETLRTVTDAEGRFTLTPVPAGRFFVHVDGRTVADLGTGIHWPDQSYYPFVGKAWTAVAGVMTNPAAGTGEIFLPLVPAEALQPVQANTETHITFAPQTLAAHPELTGVEITVPPNALFADDGGRGGRVGLAPVPPDRLPEPLPPGLALPLVITVQTDGAQNFDRPVPVRFPNLPDPVTGRRLKAGEKSALWSFNHDIGRWAIAGPMTVSADGKYLVSDPGVGIRQPGWHGCNPGSEGGGGPPKGGGSPPVIRPPLPSSTPPPTPPPGPQPPQDDGDDNDQQGLPAFPKVPDLPLVDEPHSWGDVVDSVTSSFPTLGPDIFGDIVNIGDAAVDVADEIGDAMDGSPDYAGGDPDTADIVEDVDNMLDEMEQAAEDQLPSVPENASDAANSVYEWWKMWSEAVGARFAGSGRHLLQRSSLGPIPSRAAPYLAELQQEQADWDRLAALQKAFDRFFSEWLGEERWTALTSAGIGFREVAPILHAALAAQRGNTEGGLRITDAETQAILDIPSARVSPAFRRAVIARLNLTLANYTTGKVFHHQANPGETDFADALTWRDAARAFAAELRIERDSGFTSPNGRSQALIQRVGPALGGFFAAYLPQASLQPAQENQYYVLLEIFAPGTSLRRQYLRTDDRGELRSVIVPSDALIRIHWLDPHTLLTATSYFLSGPPGTRADIPPTVWNENTSTVDTDGDGLPDEAESIVGTLPNQADSDGDGTNDAAEVRSGTNPLDGIALQPGIHSSADTPGDAVDVAVETYDHTPFGGAPSVTRILVADGAAGGVSLFEMIHQQPSLLSRLDTDGDARRVALPSAGDVSVEELQLGAVADGPAGLGILDFSDPVNLRLRHRIPLNGNTVSVLMANGLVYAGTEQGQLAVVEVQSGQLLYQTTLGFAVQDLRISRGVLYIAGSASGQVLFQPMTLLENGLPGSLGTRSTFPGIVPKRGVRLSVGENVAYLVHGRGFYRIQLLGGTAGAVVDATTGQFGWRQIAPDGTGLGVACVGANSTDDGAHDVSVYDVSSPTHPDRFLQTIVTPGLAWAVALHGGLAFVADGEAGLQVIDYTAVDRGTVAPGISLVVQPKYAAVFGARLEAYAEVSDDVQVVSVDLLVNGTRVARDLTWPFEFGFPAPGFAQFNTNLVIQTRANDSAGNSRLSAPWVLPLASDNRPPQVVGFSPGAQRSIAGPGVSVTARFNKPMDPTSFGEPGFRLVYSGADEQFDTPDDQTVPIGPIGYLERSQSALLQPTGLASGWYRLLVGPGVHDAGGRDLTSTASTEFRVTDYNLEVTRHFVAEGNLPSDGSLDDYGFSGRAGQKVFIDLESSPSLGYRWSLVHESGVSVFDNFTIADLGTLLLPLDGHYRLRFLRVAPVPGNYRASVWVVPAPQTFDLALGDTINDGSPTPGAGRIESPGSADVYAFQAQAGEKVFLDILQGASGSLRWRLSDENGAAVFDSAFLADSGTLTLTRGGLYRLTVGNPQGDFTGPYSISVLRVPAPQTFAINLGDSVGLDSPSTGAGRIESPGAFDLYNFSSPPGQNIFLDLSQGANAGLRWRLTDEVGAVVFDSAFIQDAGSLTLTRGGTYQLAVGNTRDSVSATYGFRLLPVADPQLFAIAIGDVVDTDLPSAGAGTIESPGSQDVYTFSANPGQAVYVNLLRGANAGLRWKLVDEAGTAVFDAAFISDAGKLELTRGGAYRLTVGYPQSDFAGSYSLAISAVAAPQTFNLTIGDTVSDGAPSTGAGRIESPAALDVFAFTALPHQRVFFNLLSGANANLRWKLVDDLGAAIFDRPFIGDLGNIELTRGGTYQLILGSDRSDFTGAYSFALLAMPEPQAFDLTLGDLVSEGSPAAGAGRIETPGATDVYRFTAAPGQQVLFDLRQGANANLGWTLTDEAGDTVFNSAFIGDLGPITLTRGGTYTLTLGFLDRDFVGAYSFALASVP